MIREKYEQLQGLLKSMESVVVAFSGGVDSTFLLKVAHDVLGDRVVAVTAVSPSLSRAELDESTSLARLIGSRQIRVETKELEVTGYVENSPDRCFFCKRELFSALLPLAEREGFRFVVYGEIADDQGDHRPGRRAAGEARVRAPLSEAGLTKLEIRQLSKDLGLPTWDKPSFACLSSRIPYGTKVTEEKLRMVEDAENVLRGLGIRQFRVRHHDTVARIEIDPADFAGFLQPAIREMVVGKIKAVGFTHVALDLAGFRSGSMNEIPIVSTMDVNE